MAMLRVVTTIGLAAGLIAASALAIMAEPTRAKETARVHKRSPIDWRRPSDEDRQHCGQRSFSVSVGNPAFRNRLVNWPGPCGW
jgi:hypothetical protein